MDATEKKELQKLIDHYQERAEYYEYEYQVNGMASQERAWMRNQRMADNLRAALNGKDTHAELTDLKLRVSALDTKDPGKLVEQVKHLHEMMERGVL